MILVGFAFLAGIVTIASPCIFPLLPVILSGSTGGGRARPYAIVIGFVATFTLATLGFSLLVQATGLSPDALRWAAVVLLAAFGAVMVVPRLQLWLEGVTSRVATAGRSVQTAAAGAGPGAVAASRARADGGFGGGLVVGATLGLVWTPCVGPIMASVITLAATGSIGGTTVAVTLAYSLGTGIPMFFIILGGRALVNKLSGIKKRGARIQQVFGVLMILVALAIALGLDRQFQTWVLDTFPGLETSLTSFEDNEAVRQELERLYDAGGF